jgi:ribosomal protein S12 methylthiotransferase
MEQIFIKEEHIAELLARVANESGVKWLRVMYAYPTEMDKEMLEVIRNCDNICNYIDIPLQHASKNQLKAMRRPLTVRDTTELIKKEIPDVCMRTTFIVGFPGETDEDFQELYDFVKDTRFDRVGVFTYSQEEGTPAGTFENQVPEEIKQERRDKLMRLQQEISFEKNKDHIGTKMQVLLEHIEELEDGSMQLVTRSFRDAPEIDGQVYVELEADDITPAPGSFVEVEITDCDEYDLFAKLV